MPFDVFETDTFMKRFHSLEKDEEIWAQKTVSKLAQNPFTGKPLGFEWFREKKFKDKRLYYLIYKELNKILIVSFGNKKEQKQMIESIIRNFDTYKKLAENL